MGKKIFVALPACLFFLFSFSQITPNFLRTHAVKGKVKQLTEVYGNETRQVYTFNEKGLQTGHWVFSPPEVLLYRYSAGYNDSAQITEEIKHDKGYDPVIKTVYAYNNQNVPIGRSYLGHNGQLVEKFIYVYSQGRMMDSIRLDNYGNQVEKHSWQYDAWGNRIRQISFRNADSSIVNTTYDYNPSGKLLRQTGKHTFDNNLDYSKHFQYDQKGNMTSEYMRYRNGKSDYRKEYKYDSSGNKIEFTHYTGGGNIIERYIYAYDRNRNIIEENKYDSAGPLIHRLNYKYDEMNNEIERSRYLPSGKLDVQITWTYEYDKNGNWSRKKQFVDGASSTEIRREIEYYSN